MEQLILSHDSQIQDMYRKLKDVEFPKKASSSMIKFLMPMYFPVISSRVQRGPLCL